MKYQEDYRLRENAREKLGEMARIAFARLALGIAHPDEQPSLRLISSAAPAQKE